MGKIIDGKAISATIREELKAAIKGLSSADCTPGLAVILVGEDPASQVYVKSKETACKAMGIYHEQYNLPEQTSEEELLALIAKLNQDEKIDGILCQLPLPEHICTDSIVHAIAVEKDVDAFNPLNVGRIMMGDYHFAPCTPSGIMELLFRSGISMAGKHCVIIGRSNIVGKPMAMLMLHQDATVTVCHSKTTNMKEICSGADILIAAVGKANYVTADMVKEGAVVIDVGVNRDHEGKLCGDVDYKDVVDKVSYITPVPGGVGPMTITTLLQNTVASAQVRMAKKNL